MLSLLPALRTLRLSLLTGSMLLVSLYLLFSEQIAGKFKVSDAADTLLGYATWVPTVLGFLAATLIGSLYVTALEGLVDFAHRKLIHVSESNISPGVKGYFIRQILPLSSVARDRILIEVNRFYDQELSEDAIRQFSDKEAFVADVVREVLWLDGKLAGTSLENPHDKFRSEGELRLSVSLLIPLCATAIGHSIGLSACGTIFLVLLSILIALQTANYGLYYFRRAHSFLAHHVADGKLLTPSMESAKRLNPRQI